MSKKGKISVFVIDRSQFSREGLESLLAGIDDMKYVGGADGSKGTLEAIKKSSPNVVLIAVSTYSPKEVGICYEVVKKNPNTKLLCLLTEASRGVVDECITAGATGILVRESSFDELTRAIRKVSDRERYFGPKITAVLARNYTDQVVHGSKRTKRLTSKEQNVIRLTANGKSIIQIAKIIGSSSSNIGTVRQRIMVKLDITTIAELTKFAIKRGLSSLD